MATTQELITALTTSRNTIRTKLVDFGLVAGTAKLGDCATAVDGIANNGAVDVSVQEGESYTIPRGYHNGTGVVKGVAGGGNYTLQSKTVTPTKSQQSITPDQGYYGLSGVTVKAIPENFQDVSATTAAAADVLATKVFIAADGTTTTGTMLNNGAVSKTLDATTGNQSYTIPAGYHNGNGKVTVVLEEKTATPTKSAQTITPTTGKVLSKVTVSAIPDKYVDTSDANAAAANMSLNPADRYTVSAARRSPSAKPFVRISVDTTQKTATALTRTRRPCAQTEMSVLYAAMYLTPIQQPSPVLQPAPRNCASSVRKKPISVAESGNPRSA